MRNKTKLIAKKRWRRMTRFTRRMCRDAVYGGTTLEVWHREVGAYHYAKYRGLIPIDGDYRVRDWFRTYAGEMKRQIERRFDREIWEAMISPRNLFGESFGR